MYKLTLKIISIFILLNFISTSLAWTQVVRPELKSAPTNQLLGLPQDTAIVESIFSIPEAPTLYHIQSAHGHYEAEKNIQSMIEYLTDVKGVDLMLLEGGIEKLDPQILNFFPESPKKNLKFADKLMKEAELTGPELFLLDRLDQVSKGELNAYGIEDSLNYRKNRQDFQFVLRQSVSTGAFIKKLERQLEAFIPHYLNTDLKQFSDLMSSKNEADLSSINKLSLLKEVALERLNIDLEKAEFQKEWPMLIRFFRMKQLESQWNASKLNNEIQGFLKETSSFKLSKNLGDELNATLLSLKASSQGTLSQSQLAVLRPFFERLFKELPKDFSFQSFPLLKKLIQMEILKSEMESAPFFQEIQKIKGLILESLVLNEMEEQIVILLENVRLLEKIFTLQLTRDEYQWLNEDAGALLRFKPSEIVNQLEKLNSEKRVKRQVFEDISFFNNVFDAAMNFYLGAEEREVFMLNHAERYMKDKGARQAILVTGGYHAEAVQQFAKDKKMSYVRLTPQISGELKSEGYLESMLESRKSPVVVSQISDVLKLQSQRALILQGKSPDYFRGRLESALTQSLGSGVSLAASLGGNGNGSNGNGSSWFDAFTDSQSVDAALEVLKRSSLGSSKPTEKVSFSKDGSIAFVSYRDNTAVAFDVLSRKQLPINFGSQVQLGEVSPSGNLIVVKSFTSTDVYHVKTGVKVVRGMSSSAVGFKFSPNEKYIAYTTHVRTGGDSSKQSADLYNVDSGNKVVLEGVSLTAGGLEFSDSGNLLIVYQDRASDQAYQLENDIATNMSSELGSDVLSVNFLGDTDMAFVRYRNNESKVVDLTFGFEREISFDLHARRAMISADGKYLVVHYTYFDENREAKNYEKIYDFSKGEDISSQFGFDFSGVYRAVFSLKGEYLFVGRRDFASGQVQYFFEVYRLIDKVKVRTFPIHLTGVPVFSANGQYLSAGNAKTTDSNYGSEVLIDLRSGKITTLKGVDGYSAKIEFSEDSSLLYFKKDRVGVLETKTGQNISGIVGGAMSSFAILQNRFVVASSSGAVDVKILDLQALKTNPIFKKAIRSFGNDFSDAFNQLIQLVASEKIKTRDQLSAFLIAFPSLKNLNYTDKTKAFNRILKAVAERRLTVPTNRDELQDFVDYAVGINDLELETAADARAAKPRVSRARREAPPRVVKKGGFFSRFVSGSGSSLGSSLVELESNPLSARISDEDLLAARRVTVDLMDGVLGANTKVAERLYAELFPSQSPALVTQNLVNVLENTDSGIESLGFDVVKLKSFFSSLVDKSFGVVAIPLSGKTSLDDLIGEMESLKLILKNQPNKVIVFVSSEAVYGDVREMLYSTYDERVFLFESTEGIAGFLPNLYLGQFNNLGESNAKLAKLFSSKSRELAKKVLGKLPTMWLPKSSLVVAPKQNFEDNMLLGQTSRQFHQKNYPGISSKDLFSAHLLYGLLLSSQGTSLLQDRIPEELKIEMRGNQYFIQFNSQFIDQIMDLIQATRRIMIAA